MSENDFMLLSIQNLLERFFFIPRYQRGYRWGTQQVLDLLNDIGEVDENDPLQKYCLQPLVVAEKQDCSIARKNEPVKRDGMPWYLIPRADSIPCSSFEVIDGQQRLTTIFIILKYLGVERPYDLTYETRKKSWNFLMNEIDQGPSDENTDFHHMSQCYGTVEQWFKDKNDKSKEMFLKKLLTKVYFILYKDDSDNPAETFTRLNIGKIALTNAELIKAMLLKQSNFDTGDDSDREMFRLTQLEMANQWDEIEFTLQKDDFWYFIHPKEWTKPTRIDFIFELIKDMDLLNFQARDLGNDSYATFRYFYQYLKHSSGSDEGHKAIWDEVRRIFQIFREWFMDVTFFHYIGFLTSCGVSPKNYIRKWAELDKTAFTEELKKEIATKIEGLNNLNQTFSNPKAWHPLLLLFNVQSVINQNSGYTRQAEECFMQNVNRAFYKFPFDLFHQEPWDIEHIDSATENELQGLKDQKMWLKVSYLGLQKEIDKDQDLLKNIKIYLSRNEQNDVAFETIREQINALLERLYPTTSIQNKDAIGNLVFLDSNTNRSYGNAIYPAKRMIIIGKDQGKEYSINDDLCIREIEGQKSFIPPCTRNVFMKYYTPNSTDVMSWSQADADSYTTQIYETLKDFGVDDPKKEKNK